MLAATKRAAAVVDAKHKVAQAKKKSRAAKKKSKSKSKKGKGPIGLKALGLY
jgi:hypothetical protein